MQHRSLAFVACLSLLAACGSDTVAGPDVSLSGTVSFTYSGGVSGTFNAQGAPTSGNSQAWAAGVRSAAEGSVTIVSVIPKSSTTQDYALLVIPRLTAGSSTISATCGASVCAYTALEIGVNQTSGDVQQLCTITNGTIAITSISSTRAKGTFSGTGSCLSGTGTAQTSFTVTGGTFDVALVTDVP